MKRLLQRPVTPGSWRLALALAGTRVARRLGRPLTEEEWERLDRATMIGDRLETRRLCCELGVARLRPRDGRLVLEKVA